MPHPFSTSSAPYGVDAPAQDIIPIPAPSTDTAVPKPCRAFTVLTDGTVSVTTQIGETRTFEASLGMMIPCCITQILAATTADLLLYTD